jgi:hypothetical protein
MLLHPNLTLFALTIENESERVGVPAADARTLRIGLALAESSI